MKWNLIEARSLREKSEGNIPSGPGIYKWWVSRKALKLILGALQVNLKTAEYDGIEKNEKDWYCVYVGQAESLEKRVKGNHVNGKGKSTFRKDLDAIVRKINGDKKIEQRTNSLIDEFEVEFRSVPWSKLDDDEKKKLGRNIFAFSINNIMGKMN